jgi:YfiH family protein
MISVEIGDIRYFQFEIFDRKVSQAIFSRLGGVSPSPWASLNMGSTVGDEQKRVLENRNRALKALGKDPKSVFDVWQVHGTEVIVTQAPRNPAHPHDRADAILTNTPGLILMMRFADCVPIYLFDSIRMVIGIAHAGWQGTINGIIPTTISAMRAKFGSKPADILAGIGPAIGPDHYQIGEDVASRVRSTFGGEATYLLKIVNETIYFNLWEANKLQLERSGVKNIENSNLCTACHSDAWFSHRAEHGKTGRFGAILSLT